MSNHRQTGIRLIGVLWALLLLVTVGTASPKSSQLRDAQEIQQVVERLRHQKITGELKMGVVSKSDVIKFLDERISEEYSSEEFKWMETTAKLLELMPWTLITAKSEHHGRANWWLMIVNEELFMLIGSLV